MRVKLKRAEMQGITTTEYTDVYVLEIDGKPYVPPAPEQPKVQMWECEAVMCVDSGENEPWVSHWRRTSVAQGDQVKARAKLGFDSTGRVWMADTDAQYLARCLRDYARNWDAISEPSRETLKLAAHRLAGPEK